MKRIGLILAGIIFGAALAFGIPASAHTAYPTPTPTLPYPTITPTPTVTPTIPVVNPFAGCRFSFTRAQTFDPNRGRFILRFVPAIVCDTRFGGVNVYDLVR